MEFDYKQFHINATPLAEGGHYFARAKISQYDSEGEDPDEVRWSGDIGDYRGGTAVGDRVDRRELGVGGALRFLESDNGDENAT
jgi:hypothetical protein